AAPRPSKSVVGANRGSANGSAASQATFAAGSTRKSTPATRQAAGSTVASQIIAAPSAGAIETGNCPSEAGTPNRPADPKVAAGPAPYRGTASASDARTRRGVHSSTCRSGTAP